MLTSPSADRYVRAALAHECAEIARTTAGRNARLNRGAFALGGLVGAGHLTRIEVENGLFNAAVVCGYVGKDGPAQARDTIRSGLCRGMLEPRDPPPQETSGAGSPRPTTPDPKETARQERVREQQRVTREAEDTIKAERVVRIWDEAERDPRGKLPERYFREHRGLDLPASVCGHALRFHPAGPWEGERVSMVLAALRDIHTNAVVGLHRTNLHPVTAQKMGRKMLGRAKGAAIKLTRDEEVATGLHLAEGVESALAGMAIGLSPMWAMGSVGGIAAFPVLSGIECLTVCAETGEAGAAAVEQVGNRWTGARREVEILTPRSGSDLNDALMAEAGACG